MVDDINYAGGAHNATIQQIQYVLSRNRNIAVFSGTVPNLKLRMKLEGVHFFNWDHIRANVLYNKRILDIITNRLYTPQEKRLKLHMTFDNMILKKPAVFDDYVLARCNQIFDEFKTVIVTSEGSSFRKPVALSAAYKKVQWVHTDYTAWMGWDEWTRLRTNNDDEIYSCFSTIVLLSQSIKERFDAMYPHLSSKTIVLKNIMPIEHILKHAKHQKQYPKLNFITVGRLSKEKAFPRLIEVFHQLDESGYNFSLDIIGDGPEREYIETLIRKYGLFDKIHMRGTRSNPFAFFRNADVFVLTSEYEGLPNTIYEAFILGVPVFATKVGGIVDQILPNFNGWLVENNQSDILKGFTYLFSHIDEISQFKENLKDYQYNNQEIYAGIDRLLEEEVFQ